MLSIADLAKRDGVKKPGVSRRVKQLRAIGLQVELDNRGNVALVNSVQYDLLKNKIADPSKAQAPVQPQLPPAIAAEETYDEALRQKTWTEAERAKLRLLEEQGKVIKTEKLTEALTQCGERIVRSVDRMMAGVDDMAAAVAKDGTSGLRAVVKTIMLRTKTDIADALADLASGAPETEADESE